MANTWYQVDFGSANTGGSPAWLIWARTDTSAALLPQPTWTEVGGGLYKFPVDWTTVVGYDSISFKASLNGIEKSDVIVAPSALANTATTSTVGYSTAGEIVRRAGVQLGLGNVASPFASTDPNYVQLIEFLNTLGDDLNNEHDWSQFVRECTITTDGITSSFALPADFHEMFDQSGWNRSMRLPLIGPLTSQESQFLKTQTGSLLINAAFRVEGNRMVFPVVPSSGQTLIFEYLSSYWVETAASSTGPDADSATADADLVCYDPGMVISGVVLRWLEAKGRDTTVAAAAYDKKLEHCIGKNIGGRLLTLGGSGLNPGHLLNSSNVPPTGYGA